MYVLLIIVCIVDEDTIRADPKNNWLQWLINNNKARQCFRLLSLANLLLLLLSVPFFRSERDRIQFIIVTSLDTILSLLYLFQLAVRTRYVVSTLSQPIKVLLHSLSITLSCRITRSLTVILIVYV